MEEVKKATETEFEHICGVAKQEVKHMTHPSQEYCVTSRLFIVQLHVTYFPSDYAAPGCPFGDVAAGSGSVV